MSGKTKADLLGRSPVFEEARAAGDRQQLIAAATGRVDDDQSRTARLEDLAFNPLNPRETLTELQEMADSLSEQGQVEALIVVSRAAFLAANRAEYPDCEEPLGSARFVVLDGNRRLGGAQIAGLEELRIDVNDALAGSAAEFLEKALITTIHKVGLSPLEEARSLDRLVRYHGSQRETARRFGKTHVWIGQRLALLNLTPGLQAALKAGQLLVEDARQIGRLPLDEQPAAAERAAAARQVQRAERAPRSRTRQARREPADNREGDEATSSSSPPAPPSPAESPAPADATGRAGPALPAPPAQSGTGASPAAPGTGPHNGQPTAGIASPDGRKGASAPALSTTGVDWDDLPALAGLIRRRLSADGVRDLLTLLTADT